MRQPTPLQKIRHTKIGPLGSADDCEYPSSRRLKPRWWMSATKEGERRRRQDCCGSSEQRATGLAATIDAIKAEGITSVNAIAGARNARHIATPRGGQWSPRSVLNVMARL
jgi:hypothetical protein